MPVISFREAKYACEDILCLVFDEKEGAGLSSLGRLSFFVWINKYAITLYRLLKTIKKSIFLTIVENKSKNTYICIPIHEKAPERICNFKMEKQGDFNTSGAATTKRKE